MKFQRRGNSWEVFVDVVGLELRRLCANRSKEIATQTEGAVSGGSSVTRHPRLLGNLLIPGQTGKAGHPGGRGT